MTRHFEFDPARVPLPPAEELWGDDALTPLPAEDPSPEDDAIDARLRALLADATRPAVPRDAMWEAIAARRAREATPRPVPPPGDDAPFVQVHALTPRSARRLWPALSALAATLAVGVAIGRMAGTMPVPGVATEVSAVASAPRVDSDTRSTVLAHYTAEHLSRTEALLVSARTGLGASTGGDALARWARDLLTTTRLLLDAEPPPDAQLRRLLQDLELTLALILQAEASGRPADLQAVRADLADGDLLLRLRSASTESLSSTADIRGMSE